MSSLFDNYILYIHVSQKVETEKKKKKRETNKKIKSEFIEHTVFS